MNAKNREERKWDSAVGTAEMVTSTGDPSRPWATGIKGKQNG
jgi:hypothetical protein